MNRRTCFRNIVFGRALSWQPAGADFPIDAFDTSTRLFGLYFEQ